MKTKNENTENTILETNLHITEVAPIEFNDVVVYNEMADQTSVRVNLLEQVSTQLNQLEVMIQRRHFVMKEIFHHFAD